MFPNNSNTPSPPDNSSKGFNQVPNRQFITLPVFQTQNRRVLNSSFVPQPMPWSGTVPQTITMQPQPISNYDSSMTHTPSEFAYKNVQTNSFTYTPQPHQSTFSHPFVQPSTNPLQNSFDTIGNPERSEHHFAAANSFSNSVSLLTDSATTVTEVSNINKMGLPQFSVPSSFRWDRNLITQSNVSITPFLNKQPIKKTKLETLPPGAGKKVVKKLKFTPVAVGTLNTASKPTPSSVTANNKLNFFYQNPKLRKENQNEYIRQFVAPNLPIQKILTQVLEKHFAGSQSKSILKVSQSNYYLLIDAELQLALQLNINSVLSLNNDPLKIDEIKSFFQVHKIIVAEDFNIDNNTELTQEIKAMSANFQKEVLFTQTRFRAPSVILNFLNSQMITFEGVPSQDYLCVIFCREITNDQKIKFSYQLCYLTIKDEHITNIKVFLRDKLPKLVILDQLKKYFKKNSINGTFKNVNEVKQLLQLIKSNDVSKKQFKVDNDFPKNYDLVLVLEHESIKIVRYSQRTTKNIQPLKDFTFEMIRTLTKSLEKIDYSTKTTETDDSDCKSINKNVLDESSVKFEADRLSDTVKLHENQDTDVEKINALTQEFSYDSTQLSPNPSEVPSSFLYPRSLSNDVDPKELVPESSENPSDIFTDPFDTNSFFI